MIARSTSFETRRWIAAGAVAALVIALQIVQAARVTGVAATDRALVATAGPAPAVPATPALLVSVSGSVVGVGDGLLGVQQTGAAGPVSFMIGADTLVTRDGRTAPISSLRPGDALAMTVDGQTGRVLQLRAEAASASWVERVGAVGPLAAVALVIAAALLLARHRGTAWAVLPAPSTRRLLASLHPRTAPRGIGFARTRQHPPCRA